MSRSLPGHEDQHRTLVEWAADAILEVDAAGRIVTANPGLAALLGIDGWPEIVGSDARELVASEDRERTETWLRGLSRGGEAHHNLDVELVRRDGLSVPVEISAAITRDRDGEPRTAVLVVHDLSNRRRVEQALRRASAYLRDVANAVPSPIFVKDRQHRWILCNDAFVKLLGVPRERIFGRSDYDLLPAEQADVFWAKDEEVFATGETNENEEVIDTPDGTRRTLLTRKSLFRDDLGAEVLVGVITDLTERKRAEEKLRLAAQVFEYSAQGIVLTGPDHHILSVNGAFARITGYGPDEVVGRDARILGAGPAEDGFWRGVWRVVRQRGSWSGEVVNRSHEGQMYPAWLTISAVRSDDGRLVQYVTLLADASERQAREERLRWLAQHDVLTGLPNRQLLVDRLEQAVLQVRRSTRCGAVMMLDLDHFKPINDTYGHEVGDRVLREAGRRMQELVRESDTVARVGGDEFVIVLPAIHRVADAGWVAQQLISALAQPFDLAAGQVGIAASVGIAVFPDDGEDPDALLGAADLAMYQAKHAGGGAYRYAGVAPASSDPAVVHEQEARVTEPSRREHVPASR